MEFRKSLVDEILDEINEIIVEYNYPKKHTLGSSFGGGAERSKPSEIEKLENMDPECFLFTAADRLPSGYQFVE